MLCMPKLIFVYHKRGSREDQGVHLDPLLFINGCCTTKMKGEIKDRCNSNITILTHDPCCEVSKTFRVRKFQGKINIAFDFTFGVLLSTTVILNGTLSERPYKAFGVFNHERQYLTITVTLRFFNSEFNI